MTMLVCIFMNHSNTYVGPSKSGSSKAHLKNIYEKTQNAQNCLCVLCTSDCR